MRKFIVSDEYVNDEHDNQEKQGILPMVFTRYDFTESERLDYEASLTRRKLFGSGLNSAGLPLETEESDELMIFPSNSNLNASFGSEKLQLNHDRSSSFYRDVPRA